MRLEGPVWRRSSRSAENGNCVEVALTAEHVAVRDSKRPGDGVLAITVTDWRAVVEQLQSLKRNDSGKALAWRTARDVKRGLMLELTSGAAFSVSPQDVFPRLSGSQRLMFEPPHVGVERQSVT